MKLARWMQQQQLNDEELADVLGVNRSTINRVKRGVVRPKWPLIQALAKISAGKVRANDFEREPKDAGTPHLKRKTGVVAQG